MDGHNTEPLIEERPVSAHPLGEDPVEQHGFRLVVSQDNGIYQYQKSWGKGTSVVISSKSVFFAATVS